jgi:hypothetical protein
MISLIKKLCIATFLLLSSQVLWAQEAKFDEFVKSTFQDCNKEVASFLDVNQTPTSWRKSPLNYSKVCDCSKEKVQSDVYLKRVLSSTAPAQMLVAKTKTFNSRIELKLLSSLFSCLSSEMDKRLLEIKYTGK